MNHTIGFTEMIELPVAEIGIGSDGFQIHRLCDVSSVEHPLHPTLKNAVASIKRYKLSVIQLLKAEILSVQAPLEVTEARID